MLLFKLLVNKLKLKNITYDSSQKTKKKQKIHISVGNNAK